MNLIYSNQTANGGMGTFQWARFLLLSNLLTSSRLHCASPPILVPWFELRRSAFETIDGETAIAPCACQPRKEERIKTANEEATTSAGHRGMAARLADRPINDRPKEKADLGGRRPLHHTTKEHTSTRTRFLPLWEKEGFEPVRC